MRQIEGLKIDNKFIILNLKKKKTIIKFVLIGAIFLFFSISSRPRSSSIALKMAILVLK